jgi:transposase-like protein
MLPERSAVLQAQPYERCEDRLGHANGFKPKSLATRVGQIELRIPQVRDGIDVSPGAPGKSVRSEQALFLATDWRKNRNQLDAAIEIPGKDW